MDMQEILNELGIGFKSGSEHHHCTPNFLQVDCPFCSPHSNHFRLGIHKNQPWCRCWQCGSKPLAEALVELSNQPFPVIKELLKGLQGRFLGRLETPTGKLQLPEGVGPMQKPHRDYLLQRGFNPEELERLWGFQGIGISARLGWRIFLPIRYRGEVVSWTTRAISERVPKKYISASPLEESVQHKTILMGSDLANQSIVIVEGPLDVARIGPGAVATFGLSYSMKQVRQMLKYPCRSICFDREPEAQKQARKLATMLSAFPGVTRVVELDAKDPGSASPKEIALLRKTCLE